MIRPDGTSSTTITDGNQPGLPAIAPAGTPNAGTIYVSSYVTNDTVGTVSVIRPNGTKGATITVGKSPCLPAVAPAGTPNAGTIYVPNGDDTVSVIRPDGTKGATITVGTSLEGAVIAP